MRSPLLLLGAFAFLTPAVASAADPPPAALAAGPPPGATSCSGCHAASGGGGFLPINGRDAGSLAASMNGFRSGQLPSTVMGRLMKGFSPDEIQAIAAWVAGQR